MNRLDSVKFADEFLPDEEISVVAQDNFNNVKEKTFIIKAQSAAASTGNVKRKYYALLIGVEEYADNRINSLDRTSKRRHSLERSY